MLLVGPLRPPRPLLTFPAWFLRSTPALALLRPQPTGMTLGGWIFLILPPRVLIALPVRARRTAIAPTARKRVLNEITATISPLLRMGDVNCTSIVLLLEVSTVSRSKSALLRLKNRVTHPPSRPQLPPPPPPRPQPFPPFSRPQTQPLRNPVSNRRLCHRRNHL